MLAPAFDDPALASQAVFRTVMEAMARPGLPRPLASQLAAPPPLSATAAAVALTLLDYVGLDTTYYIAQIMFDEFKDPMFASPPLLKRLVLAGHYGRKSGRGFYDYSVDPPR